jgi:hypothetical protein
VNFVNEKPWVPLCEPLWGSIKTLDLEPWTHGSRRTQTRLLFCRMQPAIIALSEGPACQSVKFTGLVT